MDKEQKADMEREGFAGVRLWMGINFVITIFLILALFVAFMLRFDEVIEHIRKCG